MISPEKAKYEKKWSTPMSKGPQRIIRFFANTHLGNGHNGLGLIADEANIDVTNLQSGEYVVFMNTSRTAIKMFAPGNVVAHLKMPGNAKIDPRIIALVPRFFNGSKINYDNAIAEVIRQEFAGKN